MCVVKTPDPIAPATPPPPPPVLEQEAPDAATPTEGEQLSKAAGGSKKYRTSGLGIPSGGGSSSSNLAIS